MQKPSLWVVIPAAGLSKRFSDAGFSTPKALLQIKSKKNISLPMVSHVINSVDYYSVDRFITPDKIIVGLPFGHDNKDILVPKTFIKNTLGQADTIFQLISDLPENDKVLVLDCDMVLNSKDIRKLVEMGQVYDVALAVTETFDPNSSRVDQVPFPTMFVEKEPISSFGIVGARTFKNIGKLREALKKTMQEHLLNGKEPYLSSALNHYPGKKFALVVDEFQDWGTPQRVTDSGASIIDNL